MKYAGMPFGMWMLFAGSFQKQLTAVLGYDADIAAMKATAALKAADRKWGFCMSEKAKDVQRRMSAIFTVQDALHDSPVD